MRLAKFAVTGLALLAMLAWVAVELSAQAPAPANASAQGKQPAQPSPLTPQAGKGPAKAPAKPQAARKAPAKSKPPAKPSPQAPQASKGPAKAQAAQKAPAKSRPPAKPAAAGKQSAKAARKAKSKPTARAGRATAIPARASFPRRDPFDPLIGRQRSSGGGSDHLPPGKAGLVVGTLRVDGLVRGPNGMIAVVSNPQQRVYFLREGDQLYDGRVEHITMEAVVFHESGKDAFGKPVDREVTKRLYPSPGEQR